MHVPDAGGIDWIHYGLDALVAGVGWLLLRAVGRLDSVEEEQKEQREELAHISGHLEATSGYRPLTR